MESLLSVLDNFERAKAQIKVETEGEKKIVKSYQSIYKQFIEIMGSLGVVPVETVGKPFDPVLHEAIMREDSSEYEEDVVIEEYRKGFQLGETPTTINGEGVSWSWSWSWSCSCKTGNRGAFRKRKGRQSN